ncbi:MULTISPECIES: P-type DNA transfer ATPase VirB11 [Sphingomonas]|uniref:P-type DNA transfer ATPase VirB11 n=1 Tax=Sphingomonas TaxID=13687 RepID=UPI000DEEB883|nr:MULTISPECIES: P-type DNA transfer ATPase VirB11 [Sphingomonas]
MNAEVKVAAPDGIFLRACLAPFAELLARADVTDIYVNRPHEVWIETLGGTIELQENAQLSPAMLKRFARQIAALTHQGINREHPLLSSSLPDGSRVQIVAPPATRGPLALAIRRHLPAALSLREFEQQGLFNECSVDGIKDRKLTTLDDLLRAGQVGAALSHAVTSRCNILIAGGTSTGKTTFLNALLREIPSEERLLFIEDTPELSCDHPNQVGLIAVRGELGEAKVGADDLLAASLRMRPDRIILGELRGAEAFTFLRAINSGHPGSLTTIHADSPEGAIEQLVLLVLQAGTTLSRSDVRHYVLSTIDVFVQLERTAGRRSVGQVICRTMLA